MRSGGGATVPVGSGPAWARGAYVLDPPSNVWRPSARADVEWRYSDGADIEAWLLQKIRAASDVSVLSPELAALATDWVTRCHLSPVRSNLLRPLATSLSGRVLEVGAGCGAITRYLGETAARLVALEPAMPRASVAAARCRDLASVSVVADTLSDFRAHERFDAITLIGVLEYATRFDGAGAAGRWLRRCADLLGDSGVLILAIENQLGLKYFAGAPEDHANRPMHGIADLYGLDETRTYGREELVRLLNEAGFAAVEVALPVPDYKLPASVIAPRGLGDATFDAAELVAASMRGDPQLPRPPLFALERTWRVVARNGLLADLANSFLIVATKHAQRPGPLGDKLAWHYACERQPGFATEAVFTRVRGRLRVDRRPVDTRPAPAWPQFAPRSEDYRPGVNWAARLADLMLTPAWDLSTLQGWVQTWVDALDRRLDAVPASTTLPGACIDLVPHNLIVDAERGGVFIDEEWSVPDAVDRDLVLLRGVWLALGRLVAVCRPGDPALISKKTLVERQLAEAGVRVDTATWQRYVSFENAFQRAVRPGAVDIGLADIAAAVLPVLPASPQILDPVLERIEQAERGREEAVRWARSLEKDLDVARAAQAEAASAHEAANRWGLGLDAELRTTRDAFARSTREHETAVAWARSLERDLGDARAAHEALARRNDEHVRWARGLDEEMQRARDALAKVTADHKSAIAWAQGLDREVQSLRDALAKTTAEHDSAVEWARGLQREVAAARQERAASDVLREEAVASAGRLTDELGIERERAEARERDLLASRTACAELESMLGDARRAAAVSAAQLDEAQARITSLEEQLSRVHRDLQATTNERDERERRLQTARQRADEITASVRDAWSAADHMRQRLRGLSQSVAGTTTEAITTTPRPDDTRAEP